MVSKEASKFFNVPSLAAARKYCLSAKTYIVFFPIVQIPKTEWPYPVLLLFIVSFNTTF